MRVPVVLLAGFLGSGKTSLLNSLLSARPASDAGTLAVIVNEFGDVGVDASLLPTGAAQPIELAGGCICCALDEDLKTTLLGLLDQQPNIARVLIETSGIAEPLPISWTLETPELAKRVRLDAVVTVVDAVEHLASRAHTPSVKEQVKYADLLVLTKLDLLAESPRALLGALASENPGAPIVQESRANTAPRLWQLLGDPELVSAPRPSAPKDFGHAHRATHGLVSVSLAMPGVYDVEDLMDALEALPANVLRIKGIAQAIDGTTGSDAVRAIAFHRVGSRFSYEHIADADTPRVVAIGTDVDREAIAAALVRARISAA